jgi:general secretion pathway protein H
MRRTSTAARARAPDAGFALVELMLALSIAAMLVAIVLPDARRQLDAMTARQAAQDVAALLKADRNAAMREARRVTTRVDAASGSIVSGTSGRTMRVPDAMTIRVENARGMSGFVHFHSDGTASQAALLLRSGELLYRIDVTPLTGHVSARPVRAEFLP